MALTLYYASGVVAGTLVTQLVAIAATALTALGYSVNRTALKRNERQASVIADAATRFFSTERTAEDEKSGS
jgi:hypothetical protein